MDNNTKLEIISNLKIVINTLNNSEDKFRTFDIERAILSDCSSLLFSLMIHMKGSFTPAPSDPHASPEMPDLFKKGGE